MEALCSVDTQMLLSGYGVLDARKYVLLAITSFGITAIFWIHLRSVTHIFDDNMSLLVCVFIYFSLDNPMLY